SHAEFVVLFVETKPLRRNEQYYASLAALAQRLTRIACMTRSLSRPPLASSTNNSHRQSELPATVRTTIDSPNSHRQSAPTRSLDIGCITAHATKPCGFS